MSITITNSNIKTIRLGDPDFTIYNGNMLAHRAAFEISNDCPERYKLMIVTAINKGWLKPIASITESEYIWEKLGD